MILMIPPFLLNFREAMMSKEEKAEFYEDIPIFMHHSPHMFIMQQNMMIQQQQMLKQQQKLEAQTRMPEVDINSNSASSTNDVSDLVSQIKKNSAPEVISEILANPTSKEKMERLAGRVTGIWSIR